jgi:hypothetical protein
LKKLFSGISTTVKKLSQSAATVMDNSPKVLKILVDIGFRSPAKAKANLLREDP